MKDIKDTVFIGGGVGYAWNNWFRTDVTAEYRADVKFKAVGSYAGAADFCPGGRCFDLYDGDHSAIVVLANAYFDLGSLVRRFGLRHRQRSARVLHAQGYDVIGLQARHALDAQL